MGINELASKAKDLHELRSMINELQAEADTIEDEFKAIATRFADAGKGAEPAD